MLKLSRIKTTTFNELKKPTSIDSKRISICYGDEGGLNKDGVIEIRRGVPDLDLGNSHYAQVRILVDGTHYLKGMAMYSDDIPDGVDIVFNTNKKSGTDKMNVLKPIKDDPENPFGALIKANGQSEYIDPKDGTKKLSAINKLKEEGDWDTMSRNLSQQFLSKQPLSMIKKQLDLTYADREAEYSEIKSLTNPTVKKKMLMDFANDCDAAAVHLQAAALPRQNTQVILPISAMKETEVYAPNYKNGEQVALIRFPHGGTFEIPVVTVNNKNQSAKRILGNVVDAVGINAKVAERLSGADFDGDQVTVIPVNNKVRIKSTPPLKDLEGFDPKTQYAYHEGMKVMTKSETQKQMGIVSNLITDMTLRGAPEKDIAKAVKHSMAVENIEAICANWVNTPVHTSLKANLKKIAADNNPWLNYYICFSPAESIADTDCPVFVLYGEKDIQVRPELNMPQMQRVAPKATVKLYPKLNHLFQHAHTGAVQEYGTIEQTISPEVLQDIVDFISFKPH